MINSIFTGSTLCCRQIYQLKCQSHVDSTSNDRNSCNKTYCSNCFLPNKTRHGKLHGKPKREWKRGKTAETVNVGTQQQHIDVLRSMNFELRFNYMPGYHLVICTCCTRKILLFTSVIYSSSTPNWTVYLLYDLFSLSFLLCRLSWNIFFVDIVRYDYKVNAD